MKSLGPCFNFYHDDYLGGTNAFNDRQHGAYLLLLIEQWRVGFLPDDDTTLMLLARTKMRGTDYRWKAVKAKFTPCGDGAIRNERMHLIRCERIAFLERQSAAGKASAAARASTTVATTVQPPLQPEGQPNGNPPSPPPSPPPEDSPPLYGADLIIADCPPEHRPTADQVAIWARAHGLDVKAHAEAIAANVRAKPPNKWGQHGAENVRYAIADVAKTHERSTKPSGGASLPPIRSYAKKV
jgi:uncharacterized protein YdaU (DUF1376 family)